MKKILMIVFASLMIAAWILPARQCRAADITFYGTYRVRLFNTNNAADYSNEGAKFYSGSGSTTTNVAPAYVSSPFTPTTNYKGKTDNNSWIDQRFRLAVESKVSDKLRGFVQIELGDTAGTDSSHIWGSGAAGADENNRLNARQYYLSFNLSEVRVKAGRQLFGDAPDRGQSFMVTDDNQYYGLIDGGLILISQVDGFFVTTQKTQDPFNLLCGYAKLTESSTGSATIDASDKDSDLYIMQGIYMQPDTMTMAGYFVYNRDRTDVGTTGTNTPWWFGGSVEKKLEQINLKAHIAYKGGKWEKGCPAGSCGIAATGAADGLKYSAYAIDVAASMPYSTSTTSREWESKLGNELDLTAVYKLYKELSLIGQIAWFIPGKGITSYKDQAGNYTGFATDDTVSEYFAKIQYDF